MNQPVTPQQRAEAVRDTMFADDRVTRSLLGMQVDAIGPGRATLSMTVRDEMLNGLAICHGGLVATLADSAFAFACNSHGVTTVASGFDIDLLAPARRGDRLTASASETSRAGRTGVYDVQVHNQRGELVAVFRGRSYSMQGRGAPPATQQEG